MATNNDLASLNSDVWMYVEGITELARALSESAEAVDDMRDLMHEIGLIVVRHANPPIGPSGDTKRTLRAGRGKTKAVVRVGNARVKYPPVVHWGWPARNIKANEWLREADYRARGEVLQRFQDGIAELLEKHNL